jgi:hypothetical protein
MNRGPLLLQELAIQLWHAKVALGSVGHTTPAWGYNHVVFPTEPKAGLSHPPPKRISKINREYTPFHYPSYKSDACFPQHQRFHRHIPNHPRKESINRLLPIQREAHK